VRLRSAGDWVKVNADQLGFYRVNYPLPLWARLAAAAQSTAVIDSNGAPLKVLQITVRANPVLVQGLYSTAH